MNSLATKLGLSISFAIVFLLLLQAGQHSNAQTIQQPDVASLCSHESAVELIKQQGVAAKLIDNPVKRISVLVKAADILWPDDQEASKLFFTEAFETAVHREKDVARTPPQDGANLTPDQRYVVLRAVAKRDFDWARKLSSQIAKLEREFAESLSGVNTESQLAAARQILNAASRLIPTDQNSAIQLSTSSLRYPATETVTRFLYQLAAVNPRAADQLYINALGTYSNRPLREFLYLATYPFGFSATTSTPVNGFYQDVVPANFVANQSLQRQFVQTLVQRAQSLSETPLDAGDDYNDLPGVAHVIRTLVPIEPRLTGPLADLQAQVSQLRSTLLVTLSPETQKFFSSNESATDRPAATFDERLDAALANPARRNALLLNLILIDSDRERLKDLLRAVDKIDDGQVRSAVSDWIYFRHAVRALDAKKAEEAEALAQKVEGVEPRLFIQMKLGALLLSDKDTQDQGGMLLSNVVQEAIRTSKSIVTARILFTVATVLQKRDRSQALECLHAAIKVTNALERTDFELDGQALFKEIRLPGTRRLLRFYVPGLDPENAFREFAKHDLASAASLTTTLNDKFHRSMADLAVNEICLERTPPKPKSKTRTK